MDSKETVLQKEAHLLYWKEDELYALIVTPREALKAMDQHARNCMIESMIYFNSIPRETAEKYIDGFLSSEYFKDLQK